MFNQSKGFAVAAVWRVESREAKGSKGSVEGKKVWYVVRDIQITQPNGITYASLKFLPNGKSDRFTSEAKAQQACDAANKAEGL